MKSIKLDTPIQPPPVAAFTDHVIESVLIREAGSVPRAFARVCLGREVAGKVVADTATAVEYWAEGLDFDIPRTLVSLASAIMAGHKAREALETQVRKDREDLEARERALGGGRP